VPYRGGPPIVQDLLAGYIDLWFGGAQATFGQVRGGQLKAYAVLANTRWFAAPDVPSTMEIGLPDLAITFWIGLWAPKGTPQHVIAKINAAVRAAHADENTRQRLRDQGVEPPPAERQTPEAFGAFHKAELERWWPFIKAANIKSQ
jgi:tripartite-type tricarboxylate transporter receptor subunit TctC